MSAVYKATEGRRLSGCLIAGVLGAVHGPRRGNTKRKAAALLRLEGGAHADQVRQPHAMTSTASTVAIVAISSGATLAASAIAGFFGSDVMRRRITADERLWIRSTRREIYGRFAGRCNAALQSLLDLRYGLERHHKEADIDARWVGANARVEEVNDLIGEVELLASMTTTETTAKKLVEHLRKIKDHLYSAQKGTEPLRRGEDIRREYDSLVAQFISAASTQLEIA